MKTLQTMAWAIALAMPQFAVAQEATGNPNAAATAPPLTFQSAFADYKPYRDVPVADWRQVNDALRDAATKSGGHAGHGSPKPPEPREEHMGHQEHIGHGTHGSRK